MRLRDTLTAVFLTAVLAGCSTVEGVGKDVSAAASGLGDALFGPTEVTEEATLEGASPREAHGGRGPACDPYAGLTGGPEKDFYEGLPPCK